MTPQTLAVRISVALVLALALFGGGLATGWKIRGWKNDSEQAAVDRAADAIIKKSTDNETGIAKQVEIRLGELKANETIIDRGVIRERETQSVVYSAVCFPESGRVLVNDAAKARLPGQPAKPAGKVP